MDQQSNIEVIAQGKFLRLLCKDTWEYVERIHARGAVEVIAVTPDNCLLLVEQYRPAVQHPVIQLPAGLVGDVAELTGESLEAAARRELVEETGYGAERMRLLVEGPPAPATTGEMVTMFLAEGVYHVGPGGGDRDERLTNYAIPVHQVPTWLTTQRGSGKMIDLRIYTALYLLQGSPHGQTWG